MQQQNNTHPHIKIQTSQNQQHKTKNKNIHTKIIHIIKTKQGKAQQNKT
jgi:hypothetical protein